jgi:hypothetical protein
MNSLISFLATTSLLGLVTACQTTAVSGDATSQKEKLLLAAGFKEKTVSTPKQQQRINALPAGKVSAVTYQGKRYYVYPSAAKDRILVGTPQQFGKYKQEVQAQHQLGGPVFEEELRGPYPIRVREFDDFGPLGE